MTSTSLPLKARKKAEKDVLTEYLSDLVIAIQDSLLTISNACLSKKLISTSTHDEVLRIDESPQKKTTIFVRAIINSVTTRKDCFKIFVKILEEKDICDREFITKIITSVDEAIERVYKAQCQDDSASTKNMELTVLSDNMFQLSSACESLLTRIASESSTKRIISKKVYQETISGHDLKVRTKIFLRGVSLAIERDNTKFKSFIAVLNKHQSCKHIARIMQQSLANLKVNMVRGSHLEYPPDRQQLSGTTGVKSFSHGAGPSSDHAESLQNIPLASNDDIRSRIESPSQLSSLRNEEKHRVEELEIQNKKMLKEKEEMMARMDWLQKELVARDREKDHLQEEVETFKFAAHQAKHASSETLLKLDVKIKAIEKEIHEKDRHLTELMRKKNELTEKLNETPDMHHTQKVLQRTRQEVKEFKDFTKQQYEKSKNMHKTDKKIYLLFLFITVIGVLFIMYILYL